ncbi:hypothetical protein [Streptomyces lavendulae]|uniref:hypothetical protein n=1 Tax=Streptomyces lavendulae TaxID=1914 RepID=UPI0031ECEC91
MTNRLARRLQYADAIRPTMLMGLQDAELYDEPGAQRINQWVDWIAKTLADLPTEPPADDETALLSPSERRAQTIGEASVTVEMHCRAAGHPDLADELADVLRQLAVNGAQQ